MFVLQFFKDIRHTGNNGTPHQKWKLVFNFCETILSLIGINVMTDCTRSWRSSFTAITAAAYFSICYYTGWYYWNENKISAIQSFALLPIAVPVVHFGKL